MRAITNTELLQYKRKISLIARQILACTSSTNLLREVKNLSPNFKQLKFSFEICRQIWIGRFIL